jgi:hypothetical protein
MGLWMVASWLLATGKQWQFVFHDDGSLSAKDKLALLDAVADARVIMSEESNMKLGKHLEAHPLCWKCRNIHPLSRKLFDVPFFCSGDRYISIDTDVLFHRRPVELLEWVGDSRGRTLFMQDIKDCTLPQAREAARLLGGEVVGKINTGIIAIESRVLSLDLIERCLRDTAMFEADSWYIEQSLYGVLSSLESDAELLDPKLYEIPVGRPFEGSAVATHYIGAIRHEFYSRGVKDVSGRMHC